MGDLPRTCAKRIVRGALRHGRIRKIGAGVIRMRWIPHRLRWGNSFGMQQPSPLFTGEQIKRRLHDITLGLWRICDRFPAQEEALVKKLKERALDVLDGTIFYFSVREEPAVLKHEHIRKLVGKIHVVRAFLDVTRRRGYVEETNFLMLDWEYERLLETLLADIRTQESVFPQGIGASAPGQSPETLAPQFPGAPKIESMPIPAIGEEHQTRLPSPAAQAAGGQASQAPIYSSQDQPRISPESEAIGREIQRPERAKRVEEPSFSPKTNLNTRQEKILTFMQGTRKSGLKDILRLFNGVGEKTIRNDLNVLCANGKLQRYGTAPRSFYVLTGTA